MMTSRRERLSAAFQRYADEARQRCRAIDAALAQPPAAPGRLAELLLQAHSLAGTASSLGVAAITDAARQIEAIALDLRDGARPPSSEEEARLAELAARLREGAAAFDPAAALERFLAEHFPE